MKIVIPMSGSGQRFTDAGYNLLKPLIMVDGKPIIEHVVNLFPGEKDFLFICNRVHLKEINMRAVLNGIAPNSSIAEISPHKKGPVYAVSQVFDLINDDEEVIVNYCDFSVYWDYSDFRNTVRRNKCHGCITAYKGFHPHLLGDRFYAGMRADKRNYMLEIREKYSFTENKMDSYHSAGTYYFGKGAYIKKYFKMLIDEDISTNGEYYVSMVYQLMKNDGLEDIYIYELEHFLQWGTPEDLEEYVYWSDYFRRKH